jgi:OOP family OmpA-OmpF porin
MDNRIKSGLALTLCVSLAGCANNEIKPGDVLCPVVGAVTGAGVVAAAAGSDEPEAYVVGAALGAGLGYLFCHEKKVPPPAPTPAPAPAPAPPPPPPPPPPAPEVGSKIISLDGAHFDFDKATLKPEGHAKLDQAAAVMAEHATITVAVEGHTDSVGSDAYNQKLSERRAQAAVDYLVSQGVDASRLQPTGYGESKPMASNDTADGRAQNRRVDLVVTDN